MVTVVTGVGALTVASALTVCVVVITVCVVLALVIVVLPVAICEQAEEICCGDHPFTTLGVGTDRRARAVARFWLSGCEVTVFVTVDVGGVTVVVPPVVVVTAKVEIVEVVKEVTCFGV